jgi:hypothetical protein
VAANNERAAQELVASHAGGLLANRESVVKSAEISRQSVRLGESSAQVVPPQPLPKTTSATVPAVASPRDVESPVVVPAEPPAQVIPPQPPPRATALAVSPVAQDARSSGGRVVLGIDRDTRAEVQLEQAVRDAGMYVIGQTRSGKTSWLINLMLQDAEQGYGFCFLDPHGDATQDLIARLPQSRIEDVILLDVGNDTHPFGINFYEVEDSGDQKEVARRAEQAVEVFRKLWSREESTSWGPRLEDLLRVVSHTLIENPGHTMAEMGRLLVDRSFRERLVRNVRNQEVVNFWRSEYDPETDREQREHRSSTVNKVRTFVLNPVVRNIVGQSATTINFRRAMDEKKIVLVKLALADIGEAPVDLLGSVLVGLVLNAAYSRADTRTRPSFHLYADEYQRFATPAFATLLAEAGKYGISTTTAHQDRQQLYSVGSDVAKIKAGNIVVFHVDGRDGQELATEFDCTPTPGDVIGYKAKIIIAKDPIERLLEGGHESDRAVWLVRHLFERLFRDLQHWRGLEEAAEIYETFPFEGDDRYVFQDSGWYCQCATTLREFIKGVNAYLHSMMEKSISIESPEHAKALINVLLQGRGYMGWAPFDDKGSWEHIPVSGPTVGALEQVVKTYLEQGVVPDDQAHQFVAVRINDWHTETQGALAEMRSRVQELTQQLELTQQKEVGWPDIEEQVREDVIKSRTGMRFLGPLEDAVNEALALRRNDAAVFGLAWWNPRIDHVESQGHLVARRRSLFEYTKVIAWLEALAELAQILTKQPMTAAVSQHEPQHAQRTYADMEDQIGNELAKLHPRTARIRILEEDSGRRARAEYTIETLDLPSAQNSDQIRIRIGAIRKHNEKVDGTCRPRDIVEREIQQRAGGDTGLGRTGRSPADPGPPIGGDVTD